MNKYKYTCLVNLFCMTVYIIIGRGISEASKVRKIVRKHLFLFFIILPSSIKWEPCHLGNIKFLFLSFSMTPSVKETRLGCWARYREGLRDPPPPCCPDGNMKYNHSPWLNIHLFCDNNGADCRGLSGWKGKV